jgi:hypothetical protein
MLGDSITLTGSGASTYEWSHGVSNGVAFAPTQTTIYKLTGRDPLNCAGYDSVTVTVNLPQSLEKGQFGSHFNLFPNPTTGKVVVDLGRELENVRVEVLDMTGKVVWIHREAAASTLELDLSALPASSYSVKIIHGDNAKVLGVIKR